MACNLYDIQCSIKTLKRDVKYENEEIMDKIKVLDDKLNNILDKLDKLDKQNSERVVLDEGG